MEPKMPYNNYNTPLAKEIKNAYSRGQGDEDLEPIVLVDTMTTQLGVLNTMML